MLEWARADELAHAEEAAAAARELARQQADKRAEDEAQAAAARADAAHALPREARRTGRDETAPQAHNAPTPSCRRSVSRVGEGNLFVVIDAGTPRPFFILGSCSGLI